MSPLSAQQDPRALDPSDVFFQAWLEVQRAEKLEAEGKFSDAWQKYRQAAKYYDILNRFHKNWKPHLVKSRVESTLKSIKTIEPKAANELAGKNAKTRDFVEGGSNTNPANPANPNKPGGSGQQVIPSPPGSTAPLMSSTNARLQRRMQQLERDNQSLRIQLQRARNARPGSPAEERRLIKLIAAKDREINTMRDLLARAPLQEDMNRAIAKAQTRDQEIKITARALKETQRLLEESKKLANKHKAEAELAKRRHDQIAKDMEEQGKVNNAVIRELRKELKTVSSLLETTRQELGQSNARVMQLERRLNESQATIKELTTERDALRTERDALANILKQSDSKGVQKLITENMRLGRELKEALDRLKFLETNHNTTKDELVQARSDLAIAKTRIMRYQQDQANHGKMIKSLESQLRDAKAALADARTNPDQGGNREEVEILQGTVKRLIAAQERRRMGEKILWETYQKSKTSIAGMAAAFKDIRETKVELTDREKELVAMRRPDGEFRNPERVPLAHARAHGDALEAEIHTYTPLVKRAFEKGRYEAARQILMDMDERLPGHFPTLCNRGVVELRTDNFIEAADIFSEAITMRENSSYAHYMLGLSQYKSSDFDNARNAFQRSLDIKPGNARAHLYLGNLAGLGKRYKQAEEHFLTSIKLDPGNADAYYNLSQLHLQQKRKKEALDYYRKALDNGAKPDPAHEQKLSS